MLDKQSIFYKIPIAKYKEAIDYHSEKVKKQEILDLLLTNHLRSEEEYDEIKYNLYAACYDGDIELIKILLSETIESNKLIFKIDKTKQTASLFKVSKDNNSEELIIPRVFEHESTEYLITNISGIINGKIKTMKFSEDSAVKTIYGYIFSPISGIKEIYFPASLRELKEGWCCGLNHLNKIIISSNGQFKFIEDKYLLGKSDSNNDEFDTFLFAIRSIKEISIPSNIKSISSYAFHSCYHLSKVEIPTNSNLQKIGAFAYSGSKIRDIHFPESLKELKRGWCCDLYHLNNIIISPSNDQFKLIENKYLVGKSDSNNDEFDTICFACRQIKEISIPSNIKIISSCAFSYCSMLRKVEIPANSNLQTIEPYAFSYSKINEIFIPPTVSKICQYAFNNCYNLEKVQIPENSNLQTYEPYVFSGSLIKEIYFPASLKELKE